MQQRSGDLWKGKVAMTGGGSCKWTLSAVTLGIEYIDVTHLGEDLVLGTAVGVSLAFDNDASLNGQYRLVQGNVKLSQKYYLYITEWNLNKKSKDLSLYGRNFLNKTDRFFFC